MPHEHDLIVAIIEIGKADTGAGGLVPLCANQAVPIVRWQDLWQTNKPPICAVQVIDSPVGGGASETLICRAQFDSIVPRDSEGLEMDIANRIEFVVTTVNLLAHGIDADVRTITRRPLDDLETGRRRLESELRITMKR